MRDLVAALDGLNIGISWRRWQLFEFGDLWIVPKSIKRDGQDALAARWRKRLPVLQRLAPAELAADAIQEALSKLPDVRTPAATKWRVIDFGSGSGGPVPMIEMLVNHSRSIDAGSGQKPISFCLTDLHPNLDAWMELAAHSQALSFIPQPVDAAQPPFSVISATTAGDWQLTHQRLLHTWPMGYMTIVIGKKVTPDATVI